MLKLGLIQMCVGLNKERNLKHAQNLIAQAVNKGAKIVVLPECFNSEYKTSAFPQNAEYVEEANISSSPSVDMLYKSAKMHEIYLVGGSIPEKDRDGKVYNTSLVFDPNGRLIAKHRKMHLFDINIPGGMKFKESDTLSPGNQVSSFDTPFGKVGVGICYDIRFPEYAMLLRQQGCFLLLYPGAFNMSTGPLHWELLQRSRALDNQLFVAGISPARDESASYIAWGHSTLVSPWGQILATCDHTENVMVHEINPSEIDRIRNAIPILKQARLDCYEKARLINIS